MEWIPGLFGVEQRSESQRFYVRVGDRSEAGGAQAPLQLLSTHRRLAVEICICRQLAELLDGVPRQLIFRREQVLQFPGLSRSGPTP